jgi:hypothetical protein
MKSFARYYQELSESGFATVDTSSFASQDVVPPPQLVDGAGQDSLLPGAPFDSSLDASEIGRVEVELGQLEGEIVRGGGKPTPEQDKKRTALIQKAKELRAAFGDPRKTGAKRGPGEPGDKN